METGPAGGRWVAEIYGCNINILEDRARVEAAMLHALERLGVNTSSVQMVFHKFEPQGLSGSLMSANALVTIHTWPENAAATLDLYLFRADIDPDPVLQDLAQSLGATDTNAIRVRRRQGHASSA